jgi:hypothetical protein
MLTVDIRQALGHIMGPRALSDVQMMPGAFSYTFTNDKELL